MRDTNEGQEVEREPDMERVKEISEFLNFPLYVDGELEPEKVDLGAVNYILSRTEGRALLNPHGIYLESQIDGGRSISKFVFDDGNEIPMNVAFVDLGCACREYSEAIQWPYRGEHRFNFVEDSNYKKKRLNLLDLPLLLSHGPVFQAIEISRFMNCNGGNLVDRYILDAGEGNILDSEMKGSPLEEQVEFMTKKVLAFAKLTLTDEELANYHVIPTRSYKKE